MDDDISMKDLVDFAKSGAGLLDGKRPSISRLARLLEVDRTTIYRWMNGETIPTRHNHLSKLEMLAEFWVSHNNRKDIIRRKLTIGV